MSDTILTPEEFLESQSLSGPLLRVGSGAAETAAQSGSTGAGAAPSDADSAVTVTFNADGSMSVSGSSNLTFAMSQTDGEVNIEYN